MLFLLLFLYVVLPVGIIYLSGKNKLANRMGAVIIAYGVGLLISHSGLIPKPSAELKEQIHQVQQTGHDTDHCKRIDHWNYRVCDW